MHCILTVFRSDVERQWEEERGRGISFDLDRIGCVVEGMGGRFQVGTIIGQVLIYVLRTWRSSFQLHAQHLLDRQRNLVLDSREILHIETKPFLKSICFLVILRCRPTGAPRDLVLLDLHQWSVVARIAGDLLDDRSMLQSRELGLLDDSFALVCILHLLNRLLGCFATLSDVCSC